MVEQWPSKPNMWVQVPPPPLWLFYIKEIQGRCSSMVERPIVTRKAAGSSPVSDLIIYFWEGDVIGSILISKISREGSSPSLPAVLSFS